MFGKMICLSFSNSLSAIFIMSLKFMRFTGEDGLVKYRINAFLKISFEQFWFFSKVNYDVHLLQL